MSMCVSTDDTGVGLEGQQTARDCVAGRVLTLHATADTTSGLPMWALHMYISRGFLFAERMAPLAATTGTRVDRG